MLQNLKSFSSAVIIAAISASSLTAQTLKVPAPSPSQTVKQAFALSDITIEYSRPGVKNRVIYGDLVPFGKVWRTGANSATKITFGEDIKLEGNAVTAGTYALYSIPNKESWEIMLYKDLTLGGNVEDYKKENEVLRFVVKTKALNDKVENFTIDISDITSTTANIDLNWDKTRVSFAVTADIDAKIMKNIETSLKADTRPYYQAANYYFETNRDLAKALEWVNKGIEQNPKAYWMYNLKAKIQVKLNDKKGAVASAEQLIILAKEDKDETYVKMGEKLIAENKK
jgi:tetratricopeptide (TPR) repeat protein